MLKPELPTQLEEAAAILRRGGVVALPTETVYGLAADASSPAAVRRIFEIKGRPADHPVIVHVADKLHLDHWAREVPETARLLAEHFWPGPLTLILPRNKHVSDAITGGQDTVGLRVPNHPIALALLRAMGPTGGLAAPSANRYGRISPTTAAHVREELGDSVDMILDGGACQVGLESTIVSCLGNNVNVLRPGGVPLGALEKILRQTVNVMDGTGSNIRVSGNKLSHYAPVTPLEILPGAELWARACTLESQGLHVATLEWSVPNAVHSAHSRVVRSAMPDDPLAYGRLLYATLRQLDNERFDRLLAEAPPQTTEWLAVADRLKRASYRD